MHIVIKYLVIFLLLFDSSLVFSSTECEKKIMGAYLINRGLLLDPNFNSSDVLRSLRPDIDTIIKKDNLKAYLIELRIQEAKIIKIYEYAAKCNKDGGVLKLKILYLNGEYDRLKIFVKNHKDKSIVYSSSLELSGENFDESENYEPFIPKEFEAIVR